jgi:hypothetical protein
LVNVFTHKLIPLLNPDSPPEDIFFYDECPGLPLRALNAVDTNGSMFLIARSPNKKPRTSKFITQNALSVVVPRSNSQLFENTMKSM